MEVKKFSSISNSIINKGVSRVLWKMEEKYKKINDSPSQR